MGGRTTTQRRTRWPTSTGQACSSTGTTSSHSPWPSGSDLPALHSGVDVTFFTAAGIVVHYPNALVVPLAVAALVAMVALAVLLHRRGLASVPGLIAAAGAALLAVVVTRTYRLP